MCYAAKKQWALESVASNWRIRKRLPRLTALAIKMGLIETKYPAANLAV